MSVLYAWPKVAEFGRVVPKSKFYEFGSVSPAVRRRFVDEVLRITWAFKLADGTVNLQGADGVPEIQVFVIDAKGDDVSEAVLTAIDKAVPFPIIFEINRAQGADAETRMTASYKRIGAERSKATAHMSTPWQPRATSRTPLPPALDLPRLYDALLIPLLPLSVEPEEKVSDALARADQAGRLERELRSLEHRLRNEPQFNRKVELRRLIGERTSSLEALTTPAPPTAQEASWTT